MTNPQVTIINSTDFDVEIFDVYNNNEDSKGLLTYTSLGKIKAGVKGEIQTIHSISMLEAAYSGNVSALNNNYYYRFPVIIVAAAGNDDNISDIIISNDDKEGMEESFNFIKHLAANPSSQLAMNFITAYNSDNPTENVNKFFADTESFNKATLNTYSTVETWQTQYLSTWQGSYYLYSSNGKQLIATADIVSTESENTAIIYIGNDKEGTIIVPDGNGKIIAEDGTSELSVSLQGTWAYANETSTNEIESVLVGTIGGTKVFGYKIG